MIFPFLRLTLVSSHRVGIPLLPFLIGLALAGCRPSPQTTADGGTPPEQPMEQPARAAAEHNAAPEPLPAGRPRLRFTSGVRAILEDRRGNTWFASHSEGVARLAGDSMHYYSVEDGLAHNQVRSLYEAANGWVWFECGRGLSIYDGQRIRPAPAARYDQPEWATGPHDLWFKENAMVGTTALEGRPGAYRWDGRTLSYKPFSPFGVRWDTSASVSTPFVRGRNGRIWIGTYGGVVGYDGVRFDVINAERLEAAGIDAQLHVRAIAEDRAGNLWIGNNGSGVIRYDGTGFQYFSADHNLLPAAPAGAPGLSLPRPTLNHVFAVTEAPNGDVWFGDRDSGAWRFDGDTVVNYGTDAGLSVPHIWQIYPARNGELWFALADGSVHRFTGSGFERIF